MKSFESSKGRFESPFMFVKNSLKALATSAGSETGNLLMGSKIFEITGVERNSEIRLIFVNLRKIT